VSQRNVPIEGSVGVDLQIDVTEYDPDCCGACVPVDLTGATDVTVRLINSCGRVFNRAGTALLSPNNRVSYLTVAEDLTAPQMKLVVLYAIGGVTRESAPVQFPVLPASPAC